MASMASRASMASVASMASMASMASRASRAGTASMTSMASVLSMVSMVSMTSMSNLASVAIMASMTSMASMASMTCWPRPEAAHLHLHSHVPCHSQVFKWLDKHPAASSRKRRWPHTTHIHAHRTTPHGETRTRIKMQGAQAEDYWSR